MPRRKRNLGEHIAIGQASNIVACLVTQGPHKRLDGRAMAIDSELAGRLDNRQVVNPTSCSGFGLGKNFNDRSADSLYNMWRRIYLSD